jgi:methyl-accepting chemotaxis protein
MRPITRVLRILRNLSIRWKMIAVFVALLLVIVASGIQSIIRISEVYDVGASIRTQWMPGLQRIGEISDAADHYRQTEASIVLSPDPDTISEGRKDLSLSLDRMRAAEAALRELSASTEERDFGAGFAKAWDRYLEISKRVMGLIDAKNTSAAANLLTGDSGYQFGKAKAFLGRVLVVKVKGGDDAIATAYATFHAAIPILVGSILTAVLLCVGAVCFVVLGVARPIDRMTRVVGRLADGDLDVADNDMPGLGRGDEFGALASAVSVLRDAARERRRLEAEVAATRVANDHRQAEIERYTNDFGTSVSGVMRMLGAAADGIRASATSMTKTAEETRAQADLTSTGSTEAARNLSSLAAAAEQMAVSAAEIARRTGDVTVATEAAVQAAGQSGTIVSGLVDAVAEIGSVVQLINDIAGQTNLLALNATIEAARAGEAGKGFAVVASEVKGLATRTRQATEEVGARILTVRDSTKGASQAISGVAVAITRVRDAATEIAASIEEQGTATREIAASVQNVLVLTENATQSMAALSSVADETSTVSKSVLEAADDVHQQAATLRHEVDSFLVATRGARGDRRAYRRVPGHGATAVLRSRQLPSSLTLEVVDVSRAGIALRGHVTLDTGVEVTVAFVGVGEALPARVVRTEDGQTVVIFRQDPATLALADQALASIEARSQGLAA